MSCRTNNLNIRKREIKFTDNLKTNDVNNIESTIFRTIFEDGKLLVDESLSDIRKRIRV